MPQAFGLLTMSLCWSCWSLMMKIISKRDRMVGMKSMLSSPFVSSQRPYTELAAASTEQREFRVVVMPAWEESPRVSLPSTQRPHFTFLKCTKRRYLSDGDGLLLHGLVDRHSVILSHLDNKHSVIFNNEPGDQLMVYFVPSLNSCLQLSNLCCFVLPCQTRRCTRPRRQPAPWLPPP